LRRCSRAATRLNWHVTYCVWYRLMRHANTPPAHMRNINACTRRTHFESKRSSRAMMADIIESDCAPPPAVAFDTSKSPPFAAADDDSDVVGVRVCAVPVTMLSCSAFCSASERSIGMNLRNCTHVLLDADRSHRDGTQRIALHHHTCCCRIK
jgi:hypothetical protein